MKNKLFFKRALCLSNRHKARTQKGMELDMSYITVVNATKTIKKNRVLSDINLELEKGKIYGFHGRNASGKTMLFRAVSGLIGLSEGEITVDGKTIGKDCEFPESMGLIIETVNLWNHLTGFENLKQLASIQNKITDERIEEAMLEIGLEPGDGKKYKKYSLGMKQKLAIAQAIMEHPDLIILDEPTNSLDAESVENLKAAVIKENKRGATILIASHIFDDLKELCHEIFQMDCGKISGKM